MVSALSFAQGQQNYLTIQGDYVSLIESGKYHFSNEIVEETSAKSLAAVNFTNLSSYQQYLADAYQVISHKNPRATMPYPIITDTYQQLAKQN